MKALASLNHLPCPAFLPNITKVRKMKWDFKTLLSGDAGISTETQDLLASPSVTLGRHSLH